MKHVCALLLLCSIGVGISVMFDVVVPSGPVYGLAGEDMLLPCVLEPRLSAEGMTVEWVNQDEDGGVVHVYKNKADSLDKQHESYRGRTELFREGLRAGNVSLKISPVRLSDANTYWCVVKADVRSDYAKLKVIVNAVGSQPIISTQIHLNGSATLVCQSEGWYPEPSIEWLTSAGVVLPSGPVESSRTRDGFAVSRRVVVQESDGRVKCRVSSPRQTKEADAPQILFTFSRQRWATGAAAIAAIAAVALLLKGTRLYKADVQDYKKWIKLNFKKVQKYNSLNDLLLDEQCVDLLIAETSVEQHERENKSRPILDSLHPVQSQRNFPYMWDLFRPNEDGSVPNAVVLLGESGYGKSVISKKILYDWASGRFYKKRFDLVLLLKCDVLNQETSGASGKSLVELASSDQRFRPMVEKMLKRSPERVLLIIDGLDELNLSEETSCPSGQSENGLRDLLRRQQHSSLLITTRWCSPGSLDQLIATRKTRFTEILGFTEKGVEKYFQKFFKDEKNSEYALKFVRDNEMHSTSCCNPVICWIICTVLKISEDIGDVDKMKTTTSIFVHVVSTLLENHNLKKTEFQSLCKLAEMGTKNNKVLFEKDEISNVGLNPDGNPFFRKLHLQDKYSFIHLSFQEFFTALKYTMVNYSTEEAQRKVKELRESVEGENPKPHHLSVIRFLLGLSNHEMSGREKLIASEVATKFSAQPLKDWLIEKVKKHHKSETLFLLHCLYELHEEEFLQRTMEGVREINLQNSSLKRRDCLVLRYCLRCCRSIDQLNLRGCKLTADGFRWLKPVLSQLNCQNLRFDVKSLGDWIPCKFVDVAQVLTGSWPDRSSQLGQHDERDGSAVPEKPQRKSVSMHLSCMERVHVNMVSEILDIFRGSVVDLDLEMSVEVDEQKCSNKATDFSNFTVKKDKDSFMLTVEQYENSSPAPAPAVSLITLILLPSEGLHVDWEEFLKIFNSMNVSSTGACEREQHANTLKEKEEDLLMEKKEDLLMEKKEDLLMEKEEDLLMSFVRSICSLKKVELHVSCLTEVWGKRILTLFQDHPEPLDIRVWTSEERDSDGNSLCSTLSLTKADGNYRLRVIHNGPAVGPGLSAITVTLPNMADTELTAFLKKFHLLKGLTEETQLDEHVLGLLSLVPNLRELKLDVGRLTKSWAHRIFSLVRAHCSEEKFSVCVEITSRVDNLCSVLFMEKHNSSLRVTVENAVCSSELPSSTPLSHLSVMAHSERLIVKDWVSFLGTFHNLSQPTDSGDGVKGHMRALRSSLRLLGDLQQVKLHINCLSERWATWTRDLNKDCPSLEKITLSAGFNALACNSSGWMERGRLNPKGIRILKNAQKSCHIELRGIKPSTTQGVNQDRPVIITIFGKDYNENNF